MSTSYNKLICETYKADRMIRTKVSAGFASVDQKSTVVGLTVLVRAKLANGDIVMPGSTAYIKEKTLRESPLYKEAFECDTLKEKFIMVDLNHVEFIAPPVTGDAA